MRRARSYIVPCWLALAGCVGDPGANPARGEAGVRESATPPGAAEAVQGGVAAEASEASLSTPPLLEVTSLPEEWRAYPSRGPKEEDRIERVLKKAARLVGRRSLKGVTSQVRDDCTGFVEWVFQAGGVSLWGASQEMFAIAGRMGALHAGPPRPGDLAFFEETYDKNRDGLRNDGITHVAVVESASDDGRVVFLHRGGSGIARSVMSTLHPTTRKGPRGELLNDYLRPAKGKSRAYYTGELFRGFASVERMIETQGVWATNVGRPVAAEGQEKHVAATGARRGRSR